VSIRDPLRRRSLERERERSRHRRHADVVHRTSTFCPRRSDPEEKRRENSRDEVDSHTHVTNVAGVRTPGDRVAGRGDHAATRPVPCNRCAELRQRESEP